MVVASVIVILTGRTCNMFEIWHYIIQIIFVYTVAAASGYLAYSIVTFFYVTEPGQSLWMVESAKIE